MAASLTRDTTALYGEHTRSTAVSRGGSTRDALDPGDERTPEAPSVIEVIAGPDDAWVVAFRFEPDEQETPYVAEMRIYANPERDAATRDLTTKVLHLLNIGSARSTATERLVRHPDALW